MKEDIALAADITTSCKCFSANGDLTERVKHVLVMKVHGYFSL